MVVRGDECVTLFGSGDEGQVGGKGKGKRKKESGRRPMFVLCFQDE